MKSNSVNKTIRNSSCQTLATGLMLFASVFCNLFASAAENQANNFQPNILVILADDAGYRDFGAYGNHVIRTPNIDRLAATGLKMTNAMLTSSQCSPSRISILTSLHPHSSGTEDLKTPLPKGFATLPQLLRSKGYVNGHLLKRQFGPEVESHFDFYHKNLNKFSDFLDLTGDKPFFMWVGIRDPHRPYDGKAYQDKHLGDRQPHDPAKVLVPPYMVDAPKTRQDIANYYDEIARMDAQIGNYIGELERRGLRENTLVVFLSDNGAPFPREKGTLYDAGMRTPLIFNWPGKIKPGQTYDKLVSTIDLTPTLLELAGFDVEAIIVDKGMQGQSIASTLFDASVAGRDFVFSQRNWHNADEHMRSVRSGQYKLIKNSYLDKQHGSPGDIVKSPSYQDLHTAQRNAAASAAQLQLFKAPRALYELYYIDADPHELTNLSDNPEYAKVLAQHIQALENWMSETNDFPSTQRVRGDMNDRITGKTNKNFVKRAKKDLARN